MLDLLEPGRLPDGAGLLLSLLVANNLANYVATSSVTYLLLEAVQSEHKAELFATAVTAPLLFVFAESTPKNVFLYRADALMAFFSPLRPRMSGWKALV